MNSPSLHSFLLTGQPSSPRSPPSHHFLLSFLFLSSIFLVALKLSFLTSISATPSSCPSSSAAVLRPMALITPIKNATTLLPVDDVTETSAPEEREFWQQPDGGEFRPCLQFSLEYRRASATIAGENRRFLMVVVSGELGQQRNEIVDAVVIARILEAALVVPILEVNSVLKDDSEFPDIFDVEHFKETLRSDVRVVSSLPSSHLRPKVVADRIPFHATPLWIRSRFNAKLNKHGVLLLKGLQYSRLSKDLPLDLQKLRCKVSFHALRFAAPIRAIGNTLAQRLWMDGPYIALHLSLEKDVWVRTGCSPGLSHDYDALIIADERRRWSELVSGRLNMSHNQRRAAGLCPLNADEVARLLKALGAPRYGRVYWAGGEPFGGAHALKPLAQQFPRLTSKQTLALPGELEPLMNKSSALAAIDYIVSLHSDVFMPSHDGTMAQAMEGHRAYIGHRKFIKPNKRALIAAWSSVVPFSDEEFSQIMKHAHQKSLGWPKPRVDRRSQDVTVYPVPECMCKRHGTASFAW